MAKSGKAVNGFKILLLVILDALIVNVSYILSLLMRFEFDPSAVQFQVFLAEFIDAAVLLTAIKLLVFLAGGLYSSLWKYAGTGELVKIALSCIVANAFCIGFCTISQNILPRSVYIITCLIDILLIGGIRFAYRIIRSLRAPGKFNIERSKAADEIFSAVTQSRVMVVGAGEAGAAIIREISRGEDNKKVVVAVDDNASKVGQRITGVKIAGGRDKIPALVKKYNVNEIILAIPSASKKDIKEIVEICHGTKAAVKIMPSLMDLITEKVSISQLRDVDIEDLLGRDPVKVNLREISGYLEGKIVMVTGGGGSIGSELCRQIARFKPRRIVVADIYENSAFELKQELKQSFPDLEFEVAIGSVCDKARMEEIFSKFKPHVIFHAAAHKHVPLMEDSPREAVLNNVIGTKICMELAEKYVADKFVLISTDKAVNPTSVMGATKRICEMLLQEKAASSNKTNFSAVRFGNVLGSNGSVIPIFRKQIAAGGPVTVTDTEITRYFMTIPEAVQLVIQSGAMANGGEIFILDMGEPVRIMDLAEKLIRLSGFAPYEDIDIQVTGLRPGEKLYEELLLSEEGIKKTGHDKIFIGHPVPASDGLKELLAADSLEGSVAELKGKSDKEVKEWIKRMVPNYSGV